MKPPHLRTPDAVIELSSSSEADVSGPSNFEVAADDQPKHSTSGSGSDSNVTVKLKSVVVPVIKGSGFSVHIFPFSLQLSKMSV